MIINIQKHKNILVIFKNLWNKINILHLIINSKFKIKKSNYIKN